MNSPWILLIIPALPFTVAIVRTRPFDRDTPLLSTCPGPLTWAANALWGAVWAVPAVIAYLFDCAAAARRARIGARRESVRAGEGL